MRARVEIGYDIVFEDNYGDRRVRGTAHISPETRITSSDGSSFCISSANFVRNGRSGFNLNCGCHAISEDNTKRWLHCYYDDGLMGFPEELGPSVWAPDHTSAEPVTGSYTLFTQVNSEQLSNLVVFSADATADLDIEVGL